jgi:hypothetical protein
MLLSGEKVAELIIKDMKQQGGYKRGGEVAG